MTQAAALASGAYPRIVGFDPAGKRFFAQNHDFPLIVFGQDGTKSKEYRLEVPGGQHVWQYAMHPNDGRGLLLRTDNALILIELPVEK